MVSLVDNPIDLKDKIVLIVEDDIVNYEFLKELLELSEAKIRHARNGLQALELFDSEIIDLVLLDIKIPHLDGYEVAKIFKSKKHFVPVIAQTAHAFAEDKKRCLDAGCDDYIAKPIPINILYEKLGKHLN